MYSAASFCPRSLPPGPSFKNRAFLRNRDTDEEHSCMDTKRVRGGRSREVGTDTYPVGTRSKTDN